MYYRPEIDGLRAIAVVPVILFHCGITTFSGGFVGVDVFFVISGFLITSIIIADLDRGTFSLTKFYERRARRILPALFVVALTCIPFAWAWMTPLDFKSFSLSLASIATFTSNILFWLESGYFEQGAELKPLLHTWSLAIEEQFYAIFPICLILLWKRGVGKLKLCLRGIFLTSLALACVAPLAFPSPSVISGAFYLLPTRAWELILGGLVALYLRKKKISAKTHPKLCNNASFVGLALIGFSAFSFTKSTPFPGIYALIPTAGAALVILFAVPGTFVHKLLGLKPIVFVGLISYSAYLWHQPLLAFTKYVTPDTLEASSVALILITTLLLAYLTWKYVEVPARNAGKLSARAIWINSFTFLMVLFVGGSSLSQTERASAKAIYAGDGLPWRMGTKSTTSSFLLYGDSHARQYYKALVRHSGPGSMIAEGACMSLPGIINSYRGQDIERRSCLSKLHELKTFVEQNEQADIYIAYRWNKNLSERVDGQPIGKTEEAGGIRALENALDELISEVLTDKRIFLIGNVPSAYVASRDMKDGYTRCKAMIGSNCPTQFDQELGESREINQRLLNFSGKYDNVYFLNPYDALCKNGSCYILRGRTPIYSDHAHLTSQGADEVISYFISIRL